MTRAGPAASHPSTGRGTTLDFTIPAGADVAPLAENGAIQQGTVAGDITVTLTRLQMDGANALLQPAPTKTLTIMPLSPVITPNAREKRRR